MRGGSRMRHDVDRHPSSRSPSVDGGEEGSSTGSRSASPQASQSRPRRPRPHGSSPSGYSETSTQGDRRVRRSTKGSVADESESDGPGDWFYTLEVVQQPQRARACGFGDKDRRPLSPPPIIRLWIKTSTGQAVDPRLVSIHFLILIVDLWSADGLQQRNVVVHPGSQVARASVVEQGPSVLASTDADGSPFVTGHPVQHNRGRSEKAMDLPPPLRQPVTSSLSRSTQDLPPLVSSSPLWDHSGDSGITSTASQDLSSAEPSHSATRYNSPSNRPSVNLPPLSSITSQLGSPDYSSGYITLPALLDPPASSRLDPPIAFSRASEAGPSSLRLPSQTLHRSGAPTRWNDGSVINSAVRDGRPGESSSTNPSLLSPGYDHPDGTSESSFGFTTTPDTATFPLNVNPFVSYSRVLVGSTTTNCQRLVDEDGNLGLFFFAHDLGVRTEGVFTLKFALTNLASLMGRNVSQGDHSQVLAAIYSDPFTVYSAKRFPGVIPTTPLTRLFAGQNVRLPTRQRRARDTDDSDEE